MTLYLKHFRPMAGAEELPPFAPCLLKRDMMFRHQFTPDYHGTERRHQLTISTWMGRGVGWLNEEPHWEGFRAIPPINTDQWWEMGPDSPEEGTLLLIYLPNRCRTPFNYVEAGIHFGSFWDGDMRIYKHLPREINSDARGWVTLPARGCDRFLPIQQ